MDVTIESTGIAMPPRAAVAQPAPAPSPEAPAPAEAGAEAADGVAVADQAELDRELRLVDAAISMVWRGVANRVTLASMALASQVLYAAQARAGLYRLTVRTATDVEGGPLAVIVERGED